MTKQLMSIIIISTMIYNLQINTFEANVYYYEIINEKEVKICEEKVEVKVSSLERELEAIFDELVDNNSNSLTLIPEGTKINRVIVLDNNLLIDFSKELLNYGGTMWEEDLVKQILMTAFQFEEIKSITISIDGEVKNLVEGTTINMYTRNNWNEKKEKVLKKNERW